MYRKVSPGDSQSPPPYLPSVDQLLALARYPTPQFEEDLATRFRQEERLNVHGSAEQVEQFLFQFLIFHDLVSRTGALPLGCSGLAFPACPTPITSTTTRISSSSDKRDRTNLSTPKGKGASLPMSSSGLATVLDDSGRTDDKELLGDEEPNWDKFCNLPDDDSTLN